MLFARRLTVTKTLCRLVGLHSRSRPFHSGECINIHGYMFKFLNQVTLTGNVSFMIFQESLIHCYRREGNDSLASPSDIHVLVCLNWFSPRGIMDYIGFGSRFLTDATSKNSQCGMFKRIYYDLAMTIAKHPHFSNNIASAKLVTMTGFSMGGAISSVLAHHVKTKVNISVRCVAIGSPRPGSAVYLRWFGSTYDEHSFCVLCTDGRNIDPVACDPPDYPIHPQCYILTRGKLQRITTEHIRTLEEQTLAGEGMKMYNRTVAWNEIHSITNYYENMM